MGFQNSSNKTNKQAVCVTAYHSEKDAEHSKRGSKNLICEKLI